jgi:CRP-like cAMP-binding protein
MNMNIPGELKKNFLFQDLPEDVLGEIALFCRPSRFKRKTFIFDEGDPADGFYLLVSGKVIIFKISAEGKEQVIHIIEPGQTFAEATVFSGETYPAFAKTIDDSQLVFIPKNDFLNKVREKPEIAIRMLSSMSAWLKRMVELVEDLSLKDVEARFLRFLKNRLELKGVKIGKDTEIELDVDKAVIAAKINAVPETFSRMLKRLSDKNVIEVKRNKIRIISPEALDDIL